MEEVDGLPSEEERSGAEETRAESGSGAPGCACSPSDGWTRETAAARGSARPGATDDADGTNGPAATAGPREADAVMVSPEYIAGFLDGEGYISLRYCNRSSYQLIVGFTNTNVTVLSRIQEVYGGKIFPKMRAHGNHRAAFELLLYRRPDTAAVLQAVLPHLIIKTAQAELGIEFLKLKKVRREKIANRGKSWPLFQSSAEDIEVRRSMKERLGLLNARGPLAVS